MSEVDMRAFGRLEAEVDRMHEEVTALREDMKKVLEMMSQAQGGWKTLMMVGGMAGAAGAILTKAVAWWPK